MTVIKHYNDEPSFDTEKNPENINQQSHMVQKFLEKYRMVWRFPKEEDKGSATTYSPVAQTPTQYYSFR